MLLGMSDFNMFKEQMVEYREQCVDMSNTEMMDIGLCLHVTPTVVHNEEMEDGEEREDLMDGLCIKPLSPSGLNSRSAPPPFGAFPSTSGA